MNGFQIAGLSVLGLLVVVTVAALIRRKISMLSGLGWLALWLTAALSVAYPGVTKIVADVMGIGRGVDLVMYCAILGASIGFFLMFARIRRIEGSITRLVRQTAIQQAQEGEEHSARTADSAPPEPEIPEEP